MSATFPLPDNEVERLEALRRLNVLDTPAEAAFDRIAKLAADICNAPIAAISLVDAHRQWFKSAVGLGDVRETSRDVAFCAHTILTDDPLVVDDATTDGRFKTNPLVTDDPGIRAYAGAPLIDADGHRLGALCAIHLQPTGFTAAQIDQLRDLSLIAADMLAAYHERSQVEETNQWLSLTEKVGHIGHWRLRTSDKALFWSDEVFRIHGLSPDSYRPDVKSAIGFYHPADRDRVTLAVRDAIANASNFEFQLRLVRADGAIRHVRSRGECQTNKAGDVDTLFGCFQDVTDTICEQEETQFIVDACADGYWDYTFETDTQYMSPKFWSVLGYGDGADGVPAPNWRTIIEPDDRRRLTEAVERHVASGGEAPFAEEVRYRRADGSTATLFARGKVIEWGADGTPRRMVGIHTDLTERKRIESALRDSEQRFALAAAGASSGIWDWIDTAGDAMYWSDQFYTFLGYTPGEMPATRTSLHSIIHPDDFVAAARAIKAHLENRAPFRMEYRLRHKTLGYRWFLATGQAVWNEHGHATRMIGTATDIHDLRVAQLDAEAANVAKSAFLATMSHEIRTPLNGVLGMAEVLELTELSPRQRDMLKVISQSGAHLSALLNDILDLSKIEAGQITLEDVAFDGAELLRTTYALFDARAQDAGVDFKVEHGAGIGGALVGDHTRIAQILNNLVSNAIKFTPRGRVTIRANLHGGEPVAELMLVLEVQDTGVGIAPDKLEHIFDPFAQADGSTTRKFGGTGLGLSISRQLAELMGGRLVVESVLGEGSTFRLMVPVEIGEGAAVVPADIAAEEHGADQGSSTASDELRLLVAEDNLANRAVIEAMLEQLGARVTVVGDGRDAVQAWEDQGFDAILMDVQMPRMDGVTATRRIRAREAETGRARTPIIAVTANAMTDHAREYRQAGMDGLVVKPLAVAPLFKKLSAAVGGGDADAADLWAA